MKHVLSEEGYAVDVALTGEEGRLLALVNDYDGMLLDLELCDRHGLEILQEMRRGGKGTPVLVVTGNADSATLVRALDTGADDYIVKPVSNDELRARVRALLRRGPATRLVEQITVGNLTLNRLTRRVTAGGAEIGLTPRELALLEHMMLHAGETVSRTELQEKVWDMHFDPTSNVIDAHMARLRKKLKDSSAGATIQTRRASGFILTAAPAETMAE
jgi:DNA-binding response OmpR family regulator